MHDPIKKVKLINTNYEKKHQNKRIEIHEWN